MGTQKNSAKTAAVMNLLSRGAPAEKRPLAEMLARAAEEENVSNLDTTAKTREQIEYIDIDRIDDDPNNFYELSNLDELAANIEMLGLQQPIRVRPGEEPGRYVIVSGHRRRAAVRRLVMDGHGEMRELPCIVDRSQGSAALQELRLIYANSDTRKLSSADLGKQAERVTALLYQLEEEGYEFPGRMRDHVAEACNVSKSKLARLKVIREKLAGSWRPAYETGKLSESAAYALAQMPGERQQVIYDGLTKRGIMPGSVQEYMVRAYGDSLASAAAVECTTYGNGPCLNHEAMQERIMSHDSWDCNYCHQCCGECQGLAKCKYACHLLADKVKQLKADNKAEKARRAKAEEARTQPKIEMIKRLWERFGAARAAAGKSVQEFCGTVKEYYSPGDGDKYGKLERWEEKIDENTNLPYGPNYYFDIIQRCVKAADLLGVSLDYLLCRTDDPAGAGPAQPEGQLVFNGWMPGGTRPAHKCDVVADFDLGEGGEIREVCEFGGGNFCFKDGATIDFPVIRWMELPEVGA